MGTVSRERLRDVVHTATEYVRQRGFESYDLFDALRSPAIDLATRPWPLARRLAIQLLRRSPFNVRPLLGIRPMVHTKTVSDMLSIYSLDYLWNGNQGTREMASGTLQRLLGQALHTDGAGAIAWGLNFPYTTRFVNAGPHTPNLFNTVNAGMALLDYLEATGDDEVRAPIRQTAALITDRLGVVKEDPDSAWVRYYPGQEFPIFNVNATVAALFVRANRHLPEPVCDDATIGAIVKYVTRGQQPDGSWHYAPTRNGRWIDGFHTGYVLESLAYVHDTQPGLVDSAALHQGTDFFIANLFTKSGVPKYYHDRAMVRTAPSCSKAHRSKRCWAINPRS